MNGSPLQLALREMQGVFTSRYARRGLIVAIFVLTVSGPFGTFESFNFGQRAAYWVAMVVLSYVIGQGATTLFTELLRNRVGQRWPRVIVAGLLAALPVTAVVVIVNSVAYQHFEPRSLLTLWLYATIVTLAVLTAMVWITDRLRAAESPEPAAGPPVPVETPAPQPPPILERVPLPQRGGLLALSVEDHYVDIVTDKGKTLVLMRLADAMKETGSVAGLQIHRSHWVARGAVIKAHRSGGKLSLELSNGLRLPVSRSFLVAVKDAGLV